MKTFQLRIIGKVQGVWYRASAKDKALALGLKGKVWNERDGAVGVFVQGPDHSVYEFIEWCRQGPQLAEVIEVVVNEVAMEDVFKSFEIVRA